MDIKTAVQTLEQITRTKYRKTRTGWLGMCPTHQDSNPSLSVAEFDGKVVFNCFAGCDWQTIQRAISTRTCSYNPKDIKIDTRPPWERTPIATYSYQDAEGRLLFQKLRFENKTFAIRRPAGYNRWKWSLGDTKPVIYNLPRVLLAKTVAVVEGEKDADNITKLGLVGTTNYDGAYGGKWDITQNHWLYGKHVLIFADNDRQGLAHAKYIYDNLDTKRVLSKTWMHPLPGLAHKQDISDYIALGNTLADLRALWRARRE